MFDPNEVQELEWEHAVLVLFEGLVQELEQAKNATSSGNKQEQSSHVIEAAKYIAELLVTLKLSDDEGEFRDLVENYKELYLNMLQILTIGNAFNRASCFDNVIEDIETISCYIAAHSKSAMEAPN